MTTQEKLRLIRHGLCHYAEQDQILRKAWLRAEKGHTTFEEVRLMINRCDRLHTEYLRGVVNDIGWPGKSLVGEEGAEAAWLLAQHADHDHEFQRRCLLLLEKAYAANEIRGEHLAYLTDRILVGDGKLQVYGTQNIFKGATAVPAPIEDEVNVDKRRKALGMLSLAEFAKTVREW